MRMKRTKRFTNSVIIVGRLFDYKVNPLYKNNSYVGEGKLECPSFRYFSADGKLECPSHFEFNIRFYGNKSVKLADLPDGTFIKIKGTLTEDLRVNKSDPNTLRSKTYIDINTARVMPEEELEEAIDD